LTASKLIALTTIFSFLVLISCEEDATFLGRDLLPPTDDIQVKYDEDTEISIDIVEGDSLLTSLSPFLLLGTYSDPVFGFSKADFMTSFAVRDSNVSADRIVDSLLLNLGVQNFFGDSLVEQTVRVYELTESIVDTINYSDVLPDGKYNPDEIASTEVSPEDSILRVKIMDPRILQKFEEVHDSIFEDPDEFRTFFHGLYVTTESVEQGGAIYYIDLTSVYTDFNVYYRATDTSNAQRIQMVVTQFSPRVNTYYHDFEGSRVENYLDVDVQEDTAMFVSSMGGVNTRISFPEIEAWLDKKPVAINKAELYIPVEDTLESGLSVTNYPTSLLVQSFDEEGQPIQLYDYLIDDDDRGYYGGEFDNIENAYVFNIGFHLQSYIEGDLDNMDLILKSNQNSTTASRVALKGPEAAIRKMKLKITYTEL
jgi:hypothetical protein